MNTLKLHISFRENPVRTVQLPDNVPVEQLVDEMKHRLDLSGEFALLHHGQPLASGHTLATAGVRDGDSLELMSAGMGGTRI